ncbi:hypothetical protein N5C46_14980 [Rossellomorea vietnamensis]|uniref:Uncharacterized protein n=1 Tax=Rossellomorea vietnamensis TaxID=218284 RepID=A0ACD4C5X1_9BACI|nr:hypothetical protein [Rossellomorea vietnamensis]UXH42987.1 hypothetical protein N5C46_14980 [Rossellomorea vietnamensis]
MKKHKCIEPIILSYLNLQTPKENRRNIITFFIIFLDIIGLLPILGEPFSYAFVWPAVLPVALLHIWAILYVVAPFQFEKSYYLFFGIYGIVNTYVYFLVIQKFLYVHAGLSGRVPFILGVLFLLGLLVFFQLFNHRMLYSGTYTRLQRNDHKFKLSPILTASSIGYVIAHILLSTFMTESLFVIIIITGVSILSILTAFFSISVHRYYFILKHEETVKKVYPQFGLPKKARKQR